MYDLNIKVLNYDIAQGVVGLNVGYLSSKNRHPVSIISENRKLSDLVCFGTWVITRSLIRLAILADLLHFGFRGVLWLSEIHSTGK